MAWLYLGASITVARVTSRACAFSTRPTPRSGALPTRLAFGRGRSASTTTLPSENLSRSCRLFASATETAEVKVPITLLSGFLGAGKTCTLQHLLENTAGLKLGVIVNDVASVNIDAKLVSGSNNGVVELQNGCACCSLADELLTSVESLLDNQRKFDALVVELSGVADPVAVKSNWNNAKMKGHPVTNKADVAQIVTLVDASTFGTDWMTWDTAGERDGWVDPADDCAAQRKVPELLAEQVESADVILINKVDLAGPKQVQVASSLAKTLNEKAVMEEVEYGRAPPHQILRQAVIEEKRAGPHSHDHDHDSCQDPDPSDSNLHAHSHEHAQASCNDPDCTDQSHSHSHKHSSCDDPDCNDPSHNHSHSHATSTDQLGIVNFVYKADRPFNVKKLFALLNNWPVPIKDNLDMDLIKEASEDDYEIEGQALGANPFVGVLRSKGFCWFAPTRWSGPNEDAWRHDTAMYWSHAGKHFGMSTAGKWWGTISKEKMKQYFEADMEEYNRILSEDFVTEEFGDRRQEIVFIGAGLDEEEITFALNQCLLTNMGMERYRQELANYMNTVLTAPAGGAGLFDVGAVDHMDMDERS